MDQADQAKKVRYENLVRQYSDDVFRYAYWLCRDRHMAEELSQEAFLRAWRSIDSLKDDGAAKSWLFTIVRRENARQYERKRVDTVEDVDFNRVEGSREYDTSTEAFVLRRALERLPLEYREPLVLQVIGGYTSAEIAEQLNLNLSAVTSRLFRARKRLRAMLEGDATPQTGNSEQ
ncbi:MAG: sigma-70 family RNA polymerase sigma factor [Gammaproteobacteria bacterium]